MATEQAGRAWAGAALGRSGSGQVGGVCKSESTGRWGDRSVSWAGGRRGSGRWKGGELELERAQSCIYQLQMKHLNDPLQALTGHLSPYL